MNEHNHDDDPGFALQKLRSGLLLMNINIARLVEAAKVVGDKDTITIIMGVQECIKVAKAQVDTLELVETIASAKQHSDAILS